MKSIPYSSVRANLASTMQQVCEDHAPVVVTRAKSEAVVMVSLADFESMQETNYLMGNPFNAARILEAMEEIEQLAAERRKKNNV